MKKPTTISEFLEQHPHYEVDAKALVAFVKKLEVQHQLDVQQAYDYGLAKGQELGLQLAALEVANHPPSMQHLREFAQSRRGIKTPIPVNDEPVHTGLLAAISGWDGYAWKNGVYIDSLEEFFEPYVEALKNARIPRHSESTD